jgi:hypothetical protein
MKKERKANKMNKAQWLLELHKEWNALKKTMTTKQYGRIETSHINQLVQASLEIFNALPLPSEGTVSPSFLLLSAKARKLSVITNNAIIDNAKKGE